MATKLKVIEDAADIVPAPTISDFSSAPTRKRNAGWTVEGARAYGIAAFAAFRAGAAVQKCFRHYEHSRTFARVGA